MDLTLSDTEMTADLIDLLSSVTVMNRDNGSRFTVTKRLDAILDILWNTQYQRINSDGIFHLYSKIPLTELRKKTVTLVSSHVDCEENITKCFSKKINDDMLLGTYDNAITNAAAAAVMLENDLPDDVIFAFTGDEEYGSGGARQVCDFLKRNQIAVRHIFVLDVTDMAWNEKADFTVENNFWDDKTGERIIGTVMSLPYRWRFVPEDPDSIPGYIDPALTVFKEAEEDESWLYDEYDLKCSSFCLPVFGQMHGNTGVKVRIASFNRYTKTLYRLLRESASETDK